MKIREYVKKRITKIKKYFAKINHNYNYEVRYNNLMKKYDILIKEVEQIKQQLDDDRNVRLIKDKNKMIKRQKGIIENLRSDLNSYTRKDNK